jgi:hypothetical protein
MSLAEKGVKIVWDRNKVILTYIAVIATINLLLLLHYLFLR